MLSGKRTLADIPVLSVNSKGADGKADRLIAGWENGHACRCQPACPRPFH